MSIFKQSSTQSVFKKAQTEEDKPYNFDRHDSIEDEQKSYGEPYDFNEDEENDILPPKAREANVTEHFTLPIILDVWGYGNHEGRHGYEGEEWHWQVSYSDGDLKYSIYSGHGEFASKSEAYKNAYQWLKDFGAKK